MKFCYVPGNTEYKELNLETSNLYVKPRRTQQYYCEVYRNVRGSCPGEGERFFLKLNYLGGNSCTWPTNVTVSSQETCPKLIVLGDDNVD